MTDAYIIGIHSTPAGRLEALQGGRRDRREGQSGQDRDVREDDHRGRRRQGGVRLDGEKVADPRAVVAIRDGAEFQVGKKSYARLSRG